MPGGVSVQYRTRSGTALQDSEFPGGTGTLTFQPGETSLTIRVNDYGDSLAETDESLFLELFNPVGAELSGGVPVLQGIGWILDNDGVGVDLGLQVSSPVMVEGPSGTRQMVFELSLSRSSATPITLNFATTDGTARAGQDYTAASGSVTFAAGQTTAFVSVDILGNTLSEATEAFNLVVTPTAAIGNGAAGAVGVGTIRDADLSGNNLLKGTNAADILFGGSGRDTIQGLGGNDRLDGGTGNDRIDGGLGNDTIWGGSGTDTMTGGDGGDSFVFRAISDLGATTATADRITDFRVGIDKISLAALDASSVIAANNTFVFKGKGAIGTSASGEISFEHFNLPGTASDYTLVRIDTDRDSAAEAILRLTGILNLKASDFML